jgi:putative hydrolase of the HAD superfamily
MEKIIQAVLFDFGNVLGTFSHHVVCQRLAEYIEGGEPEQLQKMLFSGLTPAHFYELLQKDFGLSSACDFDEFAHLWGAIFTPAPRQVLEIIAAIPPEIFCGIASNTEALHWPYIETLETVQYIKSRPNSRVFKSYEIGFEKPDPAFFQHILQEIGCLSAAVLFIDDLPKNALAFRQLGGAAEVFNCETDDPSVLEIMLQKYAILTK